MLCCARCALPQKQRKRNLTKYIPNVAAALYTVLANMTGQQQQQQQQGGGGSGGRAGERGGCQGAGGCAWLGICASVVLGHCGGMCLWEGRVE